MSAIDLTGECCCGHTPDDPNDDCERCRLIHVVLVMLRELHERRPGLDDRMVAERLASDFKFDPGQVLTILRLED